MKSSRTQTLLAAALDGVLALTTAAVLAAGKPNIILIPVQERLQ